MTTSLRRELASHRQAGISHSLVLVCWRQRRHAPQQLLRLRLAIGKVLGKDQPASAMELQQWYADHGITRDTELLDLMGEGQ